MGARNDTGKEPNDRADNAVERSLEEFIARANDTLPPPSHDQAAAIRAISHGKRKKKKERPGGTLVVLGSDQPLPEVTEIVNRLPAEELDGPQRRGWFSLRLGLAFVAGAAVVLVITRFLTGPPEPAPPVASPAPPPPIVVEPMPAPPPAQPTPVATPLPEAAAVPAAVTPPPVEPNEAVNRPAPPRRRPPARPARARPASAKKPPGLVDPFAP